MTSLIMILYALNRLIMYDDHAVDQVLKKIKK